LVPMTSERGGGSLGGDYEYRVGGVDGLTFAGRSNYRSRKDLHQRKVFVSASNFTMADFQDQRAYLKQPAIFQNSKKALSALGKKRSGAKVEVVKGAAEVVSKGRDLKIARYVRNVGLGFKTPATAVAGGYIDKKCPFTGNVSALRLFPPC
jgi:hypothetical protein